MKATEMTDQQLTAEVTEDRAMTQHNRTERAKYARNGQDIIIRAYAAVGRQIAYALGERLSAHDQWITAHWRPRAGEIIMVKFHDGKPITEEYPSGDYRWSATLTIKQAFIRLGW
jgi:hypothetical protein